MTQFYLINATSLPSVMNEFRRVQQFIHIFIIQRLSSFWGWVAADNISLRS